MPTRPFCMLALRSRSRFRRWRSAAFSRLCRWLGDSFSLERFAEDASIVGREFWGVEGCRAGSIGRGKATLLTRYWARLSIRDQPNRFAERRRNSDKVVTGE